MANHISKDSPVSMEGRHKIAHYLCERLEVEQLLDVEGMDAGRIIDIAACQGFWGVVRMLIRKGALRLRSCCRQYKQSLMLHIALLTRNPPEILGDIMESLLLAQRERLERPEKYSHMLDVIRCLLLSNRPSGVFECSSIKDGRMSAKIAHSLLHDAILGNSELIAIRLFRFTDSILSEFVQPKLLVAADDFSRASYSTTLSCYHCKYLKFSVFVNN